MKLSKPWPWGVGALLAAMALAYGCCPSASSTPAVETGGTDEPLKWSSSLDNDPNEKVVEVLEGRVSYYHDSLAGNHTANGERYSLTELTCASRTLPFGTRIRVTRLDNGRQVIVRVNDRGPFGRANRLLDLSKAAAKKLDMVDAGVVSVRAEILEKKWQAP